MEHRDNKLRRMHATDADTAGVVSLMVLHLSSEHHNAGRIPARQHPATALPDDQGFISLASAGIIEEMRNALKGIHIS